MRKFAAITGALALGLVSTAAFAAGWSDFEAAFPVTPCQDGWVGCIVDGEVVTPALGQDSTGAPVPADLRVGWFDLKGTSSFSPFPSLSEYSGELPPQTDAVADAGGDEDVGGGSMDDGGGSMDDGGGSMADADGGPTPAPAPPSGGGSSSGGNRGSGGSDGGSQVASSSGGNRGSGSSDGGTSIKDLDNGGSGSADAGETSNSIIQASLQEKPPAAAGGDCSNLKMLEPKAMLGKLSAEQAECLEGELAAAAKQTDKDKISRVLMTNAWSSGDKKSWEKLIRRHLDEIDRSDPDLCYKYALHLNKKGTGAAYGVIKWSDVALENKTLWTGSTYTNRVYSLYKLRAIAAQRLWKAAEDKYASDASDAHRADRDKAKDRTKVMAREWYEYAKSAGKNADNARALCISAAGTEDYCEGA